MFRFGGRSAVKALGWPETPDEFIAESRGGLGADLKLFDKQYDQLKRIFWITKTGKLGFSRYRKQHVPAHVERLTAQLLAQFPPVTILEILLDTQSDGIPQSSPGRSKADQYLRQCRQVNPGAWTRQTSQYHHLAQVPKSKPQTVGCFHRRHLSKHLLNHYRPDSRGSHSQRVERHDVGSGSIQQGTSPPKLILEHLAGMPNHPATLAFQEIGKIERTRFLLRYGMDMGTRQFTQKYTSRREHWNKFAREVFHAFGGMVREKTLEGQEEIFWFLTVVQNAIVLWNARALE